MFESLPVLPADPILGLMSKYNNDPNPQKVDLGVGIYRDENGQTPVMRAVKKAEQMLAETQQSKAYVGPAGNLLFLRQMADLVLSNPLYASLDGRLALVQTPGGCGALHLGAELLAEARPEASVWVSDPTWGNHIPLLQHSGLPIKTYPYYDAKTVSLNFSAMLETIEQIPRGDILLLHACCHNPTGFDLTAEQWAVLKAHILERGIVPFVDLAYQGFGDGLDSDTAGIRMLCADVPEAVIAVSGSKTFGLYRERVGTLMVLTQNSAACEAVESQLLSIARSLYSMPPDHGASVVSSILGDEQLSTLWQDELEAMRVRITSLRQDFTERMRVLGNASRFDFVAQQRGMFSYLGLSPTQVESLVNESSIYILASSRASIAGLNQGNLDVVCEALTKAVS